jgi:chemotaxis protein methyltransferase CheR
MALSAAEFAFVCDLVRRDSAIVLGPGKEYLVETRLLPLARRSGSETVSAFVTQVQQRPDVGVTRGIVEALTTNETSWFRDQEPFAVLRDVVLPEVLASRPAQHTLRVWSAACSSGQEAYSIALTLHEAVPAGGGYEILGSDISTEMLTRAEAGRFSQLEMNRGLPATTLVKHFERVGAHWQISPTLRRNVSFRMLNLAAPLPAMPAFDVIFLRNVLIYFDVETKRSVLRRVRSLLRPDGWLFLGSAETTIGIDGDFERVAARRTSVYRPGAGQRALAGA